MTQTPKLRGCDVMLCRRRALITQAELAQRMGCYVHTIVDIENEKLELTQEEYQRCMATITATKEQANAD